ncbi:MAG: FKBP-type peptidyl-prolyl cis-trans isomerase [Planctomycetota bacterium]|nr:FKBP-type peptidyl-prolyl cis-trans isomerase [Planctomycetota bacterium]
MLRRSMIVVFLALLGAFSACQSADKTPFVRFPKHKPSTIKPLRTETLENGVVVEDLKLGEGLSLKNNDDVTMHFSGWFKDDLTKFDSSIDRGVYLQYLHGVHKINEGWDAGVLGMRVGGKRRLIIPCDLGYGQEGRGPVPGGKDLIYEIDLLQIKRK